MSIPMCERSNYNGWWCSNYTLSCSTWPQAASDSFELTISYECQGKEDLMVKGEFWVSMPNLEWKVNHIKPW